MKEQNNNLVFVKLKKQNDRQRGKQMNELSYMTGHQGIVVQPLEILSTDSLSLSLSILLFSGALPTRTYFFRKSSRIDS